MPIHMQTEEVIALETRLKHFGVDVFDSSSLLKNILPWGG